MVIPHRAIGFKASSRHCLFPSLSPCPILLFLSLFIYLSRGNRTLLLVHVQARTLIDPRMIIRTQTQTDTARPLIFCLHRKTWIFPRLISNLAPLSSLLSDSNFRSVWRTPFYSEFNNYCLSLSEIIHYTSVQQRGEFNFYFIVKLNKHSIQLEKYNSVKILRNLICKILQLKLSVNK